MRHFSFNMVFLALLLVPFRLVAQELELKIVEQDSARPLAVADSARPAAATDSSRPLPAMDSTLTVSLLTCSPGQETYELYGHTAIRITSSRDSQGIVYNYGVFDFNSPHFVWRFVLGKCDYLLWGEPLVAFMGQYVARGSWVMEQVLNLTPEEAMHIRDSLQVECRPENRVYRYNIFRNNCTTRARDLIEGCIRGRIIYPIRVEQHTFRSVLREFTEGHPWAREGNDLLLGADVDTVISERDVMFAPLYLMQRMDSAMIDAGMHRYRDLVRERRLLLAPNAVRQQAAAAAQPDFPLSPRVLGWTLLALGLCLAAFEWRRRRICWPVDAVLMTLQGLAGLLLCFMALFSVHPGVATNWQVWALNPLPLFFVYSVVQSDRRRQRFVYHWFAAVFLVAFVLLYIIIPQDFSQLILPVALLLLSRAVVHLLVYRN